MIIILMLILIESWSMLIVYWIGNRKLINENLTKTAYKILTSQKMFWKFKLMYFKIYINELVYLCSYKTLYTIISFEKGNQPTDMQIRQWGMPMNANEEMFAGYADPDASFPDAEPNATLITCYADTDADLCIRIMFLCCTSMELF